MRLPTLTPRTYQRVTLAAALSLAFIIVSGAAVRLTGSGLGCPDWPTCAHDRVVAPWEYHAMVEFVNRTITGLVSMAVMLAVLGSLRRSPRRRDLVWLSLGLVAGVMGQIVLGGLTVLFELKPQFVMAHFLLSMVLLWNAVLLHHRAVQPDRPPRPAVPRRLLATGRLVVAGAAVVVFTGTVVTASGPHGGDEEVERLDFLLPDVARIHGTSVLVFLVISVAAAVLARRLDAPAAARRAGAVLLAVLLAQGTVGYVQWFNGVPAGLVAVHVAGAAAVWTAALRFHLSLFTRDAAAAPLVQERTLAIARN